MSTICQGTKKNGEPCKFRGRYDGYCKFHCEVNEKKECPICYDTISGKNSKVTSCKHMFHRTCLERWTKEHTTCPLCRTSIASVAQPLPVIYIDRIHDADRLLSLRNAPVDIRFTADYWEFV